MHKTRTFESGVFSARSAFASICALMSGEKRFVWAIGLDVMPMQVVFLPNSGKDAERPRPPRASPSSSRAPARQTAKGLKMPTHVRVLSARLSAPPSTRDGVSRRPFPGVRRRGTVARSFPADRGFGIRARRRTRRRAHARRPRRHARRERQADMSRHPSLHYFRRNRLTRTARSAVTCPRAMVVSASTASIPPVAVTPVASTTTGL